MRRIIVLATLALSIGACGDRSRPLAHRGFESGMAASRFRQAAESIGSLRCEPFRVDGVAAEQLCTASNVTSGIRVVGAIGAADKGVPYVVVQQPDSAGAGFGALVRTWGAPDTLVETGRRWRRGTRIADADTGAGRLTVWLTDTVTEARIARHTMEAVRAMNDTMPVRNDLNAVLDTIRVTSPPGAPIPASTAEVDTPPTVIGCRQAPVPDNLAGTDGSVTLMYVVDTAGRPEPPSVRVLEASRRGFMVPAVATIGTCTFRPGRQGGKPLRVLVQQKIGFHPK